MLPKLERNGPKNPKFVKKRKTEDIKTDTRCKKVVSGAAEDPEKGGPQRVTYPYISDMWVPPQPTWSQLASWLYGTHWYVVK